MKQEMNTTVCTNITASQTHPVRMYVCWNMFGVKVSCSPLLLFLYKHTYTHSIKYKVCKFCVLSVSDATL